MPNYGALAIRLNVSKFDVNMPPEHANYFTDKSVRRLFAVPGVAEHVARLSVTSYGVPELYRVYPAVLRLVRGLFGTSSKHCDKGAPSRRQDGFRHAFRRASRRAIAAALITTYFHLGRPFHLGDKLAVVTLKNFPS